MSLEPKPRRRVNSRQAADWRKVLDGFGSLIFVLNTERIAQCQPYMAALDRLQKARKRAGGKRERE